MNKCLAPAVHHNLRVESRSFRCLEEGEVVQAANHLFYLRELILLPHLQIVERRCVWE